MRPAELEPSRLALKAAAEDEDPSQPWDVCAGLPREPPLCAADRLRS